MKRHQFEKQIKTAENRHKERETDFFLLFPQQRRNEEENNIQRGYKNDDI